MPYFLLVVEGAHDAAFFGVLLKQRGLEKVQLRSAIDSYWETLIPTQFPADPSGRLDHVVRYPDIYEATVEMGRTSVAIIVSGSDSQLVPEFQAALEILDISKLQATAIVSDADDLGVPGRVAQILERLNRVNAEETNNSVAGFPLVLPLNPGFADGRPRVGIQVFPDNNNTGTLERVLLECAITSYPRYRQPAVDFIASIDRSCPADVPELRNLRKGAGRDKAAAGTIGNLIFPGSALSVSIDRGGWLGPVTGQETGLVAAREFLESLLA